MKKIVIKDKLSIEKMRIAGKLLAEIMQEASTMSFEGMSTLDIDNFFDKRMQNVGLKAVCKGYAGYKHATCISLNDVVVHGVPSKEIILKSGDFVKIDIVGSYKDYCADMARYFFIGKALPVAVQMASVAQKALDAAINIVRPGVHLFDISCTVQEIVEKAGFSVIRDFAGHGIGKNLHEEPQIPNYGRRGKGPIVREGMAFAIEPMIAEKSFEISIMSDGWTAKTVDGGLAAHVEDTIIVGSDGAEVLTRL